MLDANENESKNKKPLKEWVDSCNLDNRKQFFDAHLIPNVDLGLENFDEFIEQRRILLTNKLKELLV